MFGPRNSTYAIWTRQTCIYIYIYAQLFYLKKLLKQRLKTDEVVSIQDKVMNIKCNVIVDAWLGQIVVTGCEV